MLNLKKISMKKSLLSLAAMAMVAASANAMYIIGNPAGENWSPSIGLEIKQLTETSWEWTGTVAVDNYFAFATQIGDYDWETFNTTYRLAPADNDVVAYAGEYELLHKDGSLRGCGLECKYTITQEGENYKLTVTELGERPEVPADLKFYAVGAFQGWDPENPAEFTCTDGIYSLVAEKAPAMKISTAKGDWTTFNASTIGFKSNVPQPDGSFFYEAATDYQFELEYEATWTVTINPSKQTIKFTTDTPKPSSYDIYLRGGMNEWSATEDWKFVYTENDTYTLSNVAIEAGVEFKVADADWGAINYGLGAQIEPNKVVSLFKGGNNISLTESVEGATIIFNLSNGNFEVKTNTGIGEIATDNEPAVYYNLQGAKVEKDAKGVLIRVRAGKAEKVIIK